MATIANLMVKLGLDDSGFGTGLSGAKSKLDSFGGTARKFGAIATAGVTLPLVGMGVKAVQWASDLEESTNKVNVVFGENAKEVQEWAKSTEGSLLLSTGEAQEAAGTFGNLFTSMGMGQGDAAGLSMELVELGQDLSSFNNVPTDEALNALRAALVGEYEPMRKLGVQLDEATVKQKAMEMGLYDGTGALDSQAKILAAHALIMEQTTNAQGDAANTADGFANQIRILQADLKDVGATIGRKLLPFVTRLVSGLGGLLERFEMLSPRMQNIILAVAGFAAVLGPALLLIGFMIPAIGALATVVGLLLSPIGLVVIAIAALIGLGIYAWANDLWGVRDAVSDLMDVLELFRPALDDLIDAFQAIKEGDWDEAFYEIRDAVLTFASVFMDEVVPRVLAGLQAVGQAIYDWIGSVDWLGVLSTVGNALVSGIRAGAELAWPYVLEFFESIPGWIQTGLTFLWNEVLSPAGSELINGLKDGIDLSWPIVSGWLLGLGERSSVAVGVVTASLKQKGNDLLSGLKDGIDAMWTIVKGWFMFLPMLIFTAIGNVASTLWSKGWDLIVGLLQGIAERYDSVRTFFASLKTLIPQHVGNLASALFSAGADAIQGLINGIASKIPGLIEWANKAAEIITSIKDLGRSPWPIMIEAGKDSMDGLRIGVEKGMTPLEKAMAQVQGVMTGNDYATNVSGSSNNGSQVIQIITLEPSRWQEFLSDAQAGGNFARNFSGELGLRTGAP